MVIRLKGQIAYGNDAAPTILPATLFTGLQPSVRLIQYAAQSAALIVLFTETGIPAFFKQPVYELFGSSVPLDALLPASEIARLEAQVVASIGNTGRIQAIEQFLYSRLLDHQSDALISDAVNSIHLHKGRLKIKGLADRLYISQDAFEKRFRNTIGASPKQFCFTVKMRNIIRQNKPATRLLDLALEHGFYDQAHFNKDFKRFTGLTPTDFFKSTSYW
ncbi:hypothetical protein GCM10027051_19360 [Niabella terrae]